MGFLIIRDVFSHNVTLSNIDIMVFILKNYMYANKYAMTYLKCCYSHIVPIKIVAFNLSLRICGKIYQYPYRESSSDKIAE